MEKMSKPGSGIGSHDLESGQDNKSEPRAHLEQILQGKCGMLSPYRTAMYFVGMQDLLEQHATQTRRRTDEQAAPSYGVHQRVLPTYFPCQDKATKPCNRGSYAGTSQKQKIPVLPSLRYDVLYSNDFDWFTETLSGNSKTNVLSLLGILLSHSDEY